MNVKYKKYIEYIAKDIEAPYLINMREMYGLKDNEYPLVLSKVFNQPVTIKSNRVYDTNGNILYYEYSNGYWIKKEYDTNNNEIHYEDGNGYWYKYGYDANGNIIYYENSNGAIIDRR